MCTYQIKIDERTREGKAIKRYILKAGAVKVSDAVNLDGMSFDYRKELEKSIRLAEKEPKINFDSAEDLLAAALTVGKKTKRKKRCIK